MSGITVRNMKISGDVVWRKIAADSPMVLLDVPLSLICTCSGGILVIPAMVIVQ